MAEKTQEGNEVLWSWTEAEMRVPEKRRGHTRCRGKGDPGGVGVVAMGPQAKAESVPQSERGGGEG